MAIIIYFRWITIAILCLMANPCFSDSSAKDPQKNLQKVRQEINSLQKEISQQERARQAAKHSIEMSEKALQKTRSLVNALMAQRTTSQQKLSNLYQNLKALQKQIDGVYAHIAVVLQKQYLNHRKISAIQLLTAQEMGQQTRTHTYYQYIAKAQQKLIQQLQTQQVQLATLSGKVKVELKRLDVVATHKKNEKNKLEVKKNAHRLQEKKLAKNIQTKKQSLAQLLANEKQLSALVTKLQNQINHQTQSTRTQQKTPISQEKTSGNQIAERVQSVADASAAGKKFLSLKGKMKLPMAGHITGKFGRPRGAEGGTWKGLFISAKPGQNIHAIADGKIVYAGYLKGFGKLSLVDHGGNYFSIYAGLSAIHTAMGKKIRAGDILGQSGTLESGEIGLYFEIRHESTPINPLNWAVL